jgi:hypothetical protein
MSTSGERIVQPVVRRQFEHRPRTLRPAFGRRADSEEGALATPATAQISSTLVAA